MKRVVFGVLVLAVLVWAAVGLFTGTWEPRGVPEPPTQEGVDGAGLTGRLQNGDESPPEAPASIPPARTEDDAENREEGKNASRAQLLDSATGLPVAEVLVHVVAARDGNDAVSWVGDRLWAGRTDAEGFLKHPSLPRPPKDVQHWAIFVKAPYLTRVLAWNEVTDSASVQLDPSSAVTVTMDPVPEVGQLGYLRLMATPLSPDGSEVSKYGFLTPRGNLAREVLVDLPESGAEVRGLCSENVTYELHLLCDPQLFDSKPQRHVGSGNVHFQLTPLAAVKVVLEPPPTSPGACYLERADGDPRDVSFSRRIESGVVWFEAATVQPGEHLISAHGTDWRSRGKAIVFLGPEKPKVQTVILSIETETRIAHLKVDTPPERFRLESPTVHIVEDSGAVSLYPERDRGDGYGWLVVPRPEQEFRLLGLSKLPVTVLVVGYDSNEFVPVEIPYVPFEVSVGFPEPNEVLKIPEGPEIARKVADELEPWEAQSYLGRLLLQVGLRIRPGAVTWFTIRVFRLADPRSLEEEAWTMRLDPRHEYRVLGYDENGDRYFRVTTSR